jgi:hypothetical protein
VVSFLVWLTLCVCVCVCVYMCAMQAGAAGAGTAAGTHCRGRACLTTQLTGEGCCHGERQAKGGAAERNQAGVREGISAPAMHADGSTVVLQVVMQGGLAAYDTPPPPLRMLDAGSPVLSPGGSSYV